MKLSRHSVFDPNSQELRENPYSYLGNIRDHSPIQKSCGMWVFTKYLDVKELLANNSLSVTHIPNLVSSIAREAYAGISQLGKYAIVFTDPPEHGRLRKLHMKAFSRKQLVHYHDMIKKQVMITLENALSSESPIDVVEQIANDIPIRVISHLLGIPEEHHMEIAEKLLFVRTLLEPSAITPRRQRKIEQQLQYCLNIFRSLISQKRKNPSGDLLSSLITSQIEKDYLSDEEIEISCVFTYIAGHETTKSLISSGIKLFSENPGQWKQVCQSQNMVASAIEEILRYEPPLHFTTRISKHDFEFRSHQIASNDVLLLCIASANRDPQIFSDPDRFNISRPAVNNLSFGYGMHNCLGQQLARMEAVLLFKEMAKKNIDIIHKDSYDEQWASKGATTRSLKHFQVILKPAD